MTSIKIVYPVFHEQLPLFFSSPAKASSILLRFLTTTLLLSRENVPRGLAGRMSQPHLCSISQRTRRKLDLRRGSDA